MHVTFVFHTEFLRHWIYGERPIARGIKEINLLQKHGHKISVVSWIKDKRDLPKQETWKDIEIHRIFIEPPKTSALKRFLVHRKVIKELADKIAFLKPDAVVCHDPEILKAGVIAKKTLKVPLFYDSHEDYPAMISEHNKLEGFIFKIMERRLVKHVDHTYTVCEPIADKFRNMRAPVTVLHNSRSLDGAPQKSDPISKEKRREAGFVEEDFIIGFVGNLTEHSNIETLIGILKDLPEDVKLMVIGGPKDRIKELKALAKDIGVEERVHFQGPVAYKDLLDYITVFDVGTAILPLVSKNYLFRSPNKLFEYMAVGIPLIVSDFPNMRMIVVEDCRCGLAVDPKDRQSILKAVKTLFEDKEKRQEMGGNARNCFENKYSWEKQEEKLAGSHPVFG